MLNARQGYVFKHEAIHKKVPGILKVEQKTKVVTWKPDTPSVPPLEIRNVTDVEKIRREDMEYICVTYGERSRKEEKVVFVFQGPDNIETSLLFYDLLKLHLEEFYKRRFTTLSFLDKKRLMLLMEEDYLKDLFDTILSKHQIFNSIENFWNFVKKQHPEKIRTCLNENKIQSSRTDELSLKGPINFNYLIKNRILFGYDDVKMLYEDFISKQEQLNKEKIFWEEFMKNQAKKSTEIVGGMDKVFFTPEEEMKISTLKKKKDQLKKKDRNKEEYGKQFEMVERHILYVDNYEGTCINLPETEYNEKRGQREIFKDEALNRKEIANIISSINNYSSRKINSLNYIPRFKKKFYATYVKNKYGSSFSFQNENERENRDDEDIQMIEEVEMNHNKKGYLESRLNEMEKEFKEKPKEVFKPTFDRINRKIIENEKKEEAIDIPKKESSKIKKMIELGELVRDLKCIYEMFKNRRRTNTGEVGALLKEALRKAQQEKLKNPTDIVLEQINVISSIIPQSTISN